MFPVGENQELLNTAWKARVESLERKIQTVILDDDGDDSVSHYSSDEDSRHVETESQSVEKVQEDLIDLTTESSRKGEMEEEDLQDISDGT